MREPVYMAREDYAGGARNEETAAAEPPTHTKRLGAGQRLNTAKSMIGYPRIALLPISKRGRPARIAAIPTASSKHKPTRTRDNEDCLAVDPGVQQRAPSPAPTLEAGRAVLTAGTAIRSS